MESVSSTDAIAVTFNVLLSIPSNLMTKSLTLTTVGFEPYINSHVQPLTTSTMKITMKATYIIRGRLFSLWSYLVAPTTTKGNTTNNKTIITRLKYAVKCKSVKMIDRAITTHPRHIRHQR